MAATEPAVVKRARKVADGPGPAEEETPPVENTTDPMGPVARRRFDPGAHLRKLRGRGGETEYLDVKWRLVWLRSEHPDAAILTELIDHEPGVRAIFRSRVSIPGAGSATGYGSETATDFGDYLEKAETKATGRALIALGYGTEFASVQEIPETTQEPNILTDEEFAALLSVTDEFSRVRAAFRAIKDHLNLWRPSMSKEQRERVRVWLNEEIAVRKGRGEEIE